MISVYNAAVRHDVQAVMKNKAAPRELLDSISMWRREKHNENTLALLVKHAVLNDSLVRHIPTLVDLNLFDIKLLDTKPSLVRMFAALESGGFSALIIEKAMRRAVNMTDNYIAHHACDVESFVRQLSNRDDHKKRR